MANDRSAAMRQFGLAALSSFFIAAPCADFARAQDFVMKFGTQTINDLQHEYLKVYKAELEKATNGKIKVEVYPASQLGLFPRMLEGVRLGTIEGLLAPAEFFVGADARYQALAMSGLFNDIDHARKIFNRPEARQAVYAVAEGRGFVTGTVMPYDLQMFVSKTPITKLTDFNGKRMRVLASEAEQAAVKSLGAATIPLPLPEVLPALQQGTVDGATAVISVYAGLRYYDAAPYALDTRLWALISVAQISKVWLDKLPPDLQKAVRETGPKIEPQMHQWQLARLKADREKWTANNGKIATLSPAEQAEAKKRVAESIQPLLAKNAALKAFYDKLKSLAESTK
jgi:TRAP-type C4-dicarboxylate transport system substrate-binding protein